MSKKAKYRKVFNIVYFSNRYQKHLWCIEKGLSQCVTLCAPNNLFIQKSVYYPNKVGYLGSNLLVGF